MAREFDVTVTQLVSNTAARVWRAPEPGREGQAYGLRLERIVASSGRKVVVREGVRLRVRLDSHGRIDRAEVLPAATARNNRAAYA